MLAARSRALGSFLLCLCSIALPTTRTGATTTLDTRFVSSLDSVAALFGSGEFEGAIGACERLADRAAQHFGPRSAETARAWAVLAQLRQRSPGHHQLAALEAAQRAVQIAEQLDAPGRELMGNALIIRGSIQSDLQELDLAIEDLERGVEILEQSTSSPIVMATALSHLAWVLVRAERLADARRRAESSLELRVQALGPEHLDVAWNHAQLRAIAVLEGDYERAEDLSAKELDGFERHAGLADVSAWLADAILARGWLLHLSGKSAAARETYERAIAMLEATGRTEERRMIDAYTNMGLLERDVGRLDRARTALESAVALARAGEGPAQSLAATPLSSLGQVLLQLGEFELAELQLQDALRIQEAAYGHVSRHVEWVLHGLAELELARGDFRRALEFLDEAASIRQQIGSHRGLPEVDRLARRATVLREMGDLKGAQAHLDDAIARLPADWARTHHQGRLLADRAALRLLRSDASGALTDALASEALLRAELGIAHPAVAQASLSAARAYRALGAPAAALSWALRAEGARRAHVELIAAGLSERDLLQTAVRSSGIDLAIDLLAVEGTTRMPAALIDSTYTELIRSRSLLFDELARRHRAVPDAGDPQTLELWRQLAAVRSRMGNIALRLAAREDEGKGADLLRELRMRKSELERALLDRGVRAVTLGRREDSATALRQRLPAGAAVVSYVVSREGEGWYGAFIQKSDAAPLFVRLAPRELVERQFEAWFREAAQGSQLPGRSPARAEEIYKEEALALSELIWIPAQASLNGCPEINVVPDGILHGLQWDALPDGEVYLIEGPARLRRLTAEADLHAAQTPRESAAHSLVAVGGIDFAASARIAATRGATVCPRETGLGFGELPESLAEVRAIAGLWGSAPNRSTVVLTGLEASELALRENATTAEILHVATHAWALDPNCTYEAGGQSNQLNQLVVGNPMILSGIALAGANRAGAVDADADGLLTAEEICSLELAQAQVVVLSACSTAAGARADRDGVYGLQRAFQLAGARTVAVSLWPIPDRSTRELMVGVYQRWLANDIQFDHALREQAQSVLTARRGRGVSTHPFHWAPFVAISSN